MLEIYQVSKSFPTPQGPLAVLQSISLNLAAGNTLALTGESGSGKSTLLHLVAGLDSVDAGTVRVGGETVTGRADADRARLRRTTIGLVFQQFNLLPSLTVGANLAFQARLCGRHEPAHLADLTRRLGLDGLLDRYPEQLSGGQQQRVAIGRTLAARPQLILADEPTGNLDEATGDAVLDLFLDEVRASGAALLMVTHSERLAARLGHQHHLSQGRLESRS
ncbi:ABC transporter ATP-binding protein [Natronospirillum operosum]|uniref:ABC transporter ATP-binding protein n=1 Tax=Natronospirillum operosum TaxID=2759953 RepID=A0A4Z0W6W2_9GAMM|nr:ABC transporter ATP-binding protein [Natronospirillum operosum]TGG90232.1 ABC transporter ATP-binding protein [Natronospirillum operosum]